MDVIRVDRLVVIIVAVPPGLYKVRRGVLVSDVFK